MRKRVHIKSVIRNPFDNCEKTLKMIKRQAYKRTQSSTGLLKLLNKGNINSSNQSSLKQANDDQDLFLVVEKEDTIDEDTVNNNNCINIRENEMLPLDEEKIRSVLKKHFLFDDLPNDIIQFILEELVLIHISKGNYIYRKGFQGDFFYIISKGSVSLISKGKTIKQYSEWDCFGYMSLFCNRTISKNDNHAICDSNVSLYVLDGESFQSIQKQLIKFRLEENFKFVDTIEEFASLNNVERYNIAEKIQKITFNKNEDIAMDNNRLLFVKEGIIEVMNRNNNSNTNDTIKTIQQYDCYGIDCILIDESKSNYDKSLTNYKLKAIQKSTCYEIFRIDLIESLGIFYKDVILKSLFKAFISRHSYFKDLFTEKVLNEIFPMFQIRKYSKGQRVWNESGSNKVIVIVIDGHLINEESKETIASKGDIIGENVVKSNTEISKHLIALPECFAIQCDFSSINNLLGSNYHSPMVKLMKRIKRLKVISIFKYLSQDIITQIAESIKVEKYHKDQIIIQETTKGDTFFIISKGRVQILKNGVFIREMEKGNCFGETALFQNDNLRTATVIAIEDVSCYLISKGDFDVIVKNPIIKNHLELKMSLQDGSIDLSDLHFIKSLGKGRCGHVSLVHNKKNIYALKTVSVLQTNKNNMQRYLLTERKLLLLIDHPFIIRMVKTFKSNSFCYFLLEYAHGQAFDDYLTKRFQFKKIGELRFFTSCILVMIDYLNKKSIAHRDIKPSNIIIDSNGYLKLIDFGAAKLISDYTSTVIGTPQYMAPEVLKGKGYSMACDYWSIGICAYEIYYGKMPFGNDSADVISIYQSIINDQPYYNDKGKDKIVNEMIKALLNKQVNKRICNLAQLKNLKLFESINFEQLINFTIEPPYKPQTKEVNIKHYDDLKYVHYEERMMDYLEGEEKGKTPQNENDIQWVNEFQ